MNEKLGILIRIVSFIMIVIGLACMGSGFWVGIVAALKVVGVLATIFTFFKVWGLLFGVGLCFALIGAFGIVCVAD